jgi:ABC-type transport system involved in Fe-S cluster assembly fused permease/ATPase subunit
LTKRPQVSTCISIVLMMAKLEVFVDLTFVNLSLTALDSESEMVVQEALDKIMFDKTKTTIVIAHRLSTIRNGKSVIC